jgi:hypothetical protein
LLSGTLYWLHVCNGNLILRLVIKEINEFPISSV